MEFNSIDLLQKLGLTEYEAKTLGALFKLKESEVPHISRAAQVPKTRVYDVLDKLVEKNLIIEIYGRPKKYKVVETEQAFSELINSKKKEIKDLEQQVEKIKENFQSPTGFIEESKERVMKVKNKQDFLRILGQEIKQAKNQLLAFSNINGNQEAISDSIKKAKEKKVERKILSKLNAKGATIAREYAQKGVSLKQFDHGLNAFIIDGKKVVLALTDFEEEKPEYHFTIWQNNKPMAVALQNYFDQCWKKGKTF